MAGKEVFLRENHVCTLCCTAVFSHLVLAATAYMHKTYYTVVLECMEVNNGVTCTLYKSVY